jgi:drug/metabolite transporter (DMT)-like permease
MAWLLPLILVLCSAGLHAGWNLIVKGEDDKLFSGWLTVLTPALLLSPVLLVMGLPPPEAWPILLGSAVIHTGYMIALTQAYVHGDLSVVYPVARGLAPILVAVGAPLFLGERLSLTAILGIVLVGGGIAWLGVSARRSSAGFSGIAWAVATAVFIASYSIMDKVGVSRTNPVSYIIVLMGANAVFMTPVVLWRRDARLMAAVWKRRWRSAVLGGLLSITAYLLVLIAMRLTQVSYIAALRESSVVLAALLGWRVLREPYGGRRILAAIVVTLGLILLVLAMRG